MNAQIITLIIVACIAALVIITRLLIKEEDLIKKAEKNWFYHVLAKMTSAKYDGYLMDDDEKKALDEFVSKPSQYDTHPIGSYFKMRKELGEILKIGGNFHNYSMGFNLGEVGTGVMVMLVFAIVVMLGVIYC